MTGPDSSGCSLVELLIAMAMVTVLALLGWTHSAEVLARQRLEAATQELLAGIARARSEAESLGQPCALSLTAQGWVAPAAGTLPPCRRALARFEGPVALSHSFPASLRFSRNGLVIDAGTAVLQAPATGLRRCVVMALPLGVLRVGRYSGDPGAVPLASACQGEP